MGYIQGGGWLILGGFLNSFAPSQEQYKLVARIVATKPPQLHLTTLRRLNKTAFFIGQICELPHHEFPPRTKILRKEICWK